MTLKEKLGDAEYAELLALLEPPPGNLKAWATGALKSWTTWFGAFLISAPQLLPELLPQLKELLTPENYMRVVQAFGIIVILLRVKTTTSLAEKGKV